MRHRRKGRKLGRTGAHRKALLSNMAIALFQHERIQTTEPKSKELRRTAEKLITLAKRGDLHARRRAARTIRDKVILQKLFDDIGPRYAERNRPRVGSSHVATNAEPNDSGSRRRARGAGHL